MPSIPFMEVVPCKVPLPALRVAVTIVELSEAHKNWLLPKKHAGGCG